ncbi:hypothetical protein KF728_23890 [Candidatus Obscuribacterales bacterium]|nr:hypothetical protein [Candidatus Obscuribacterales bacterium]
MSNHLKAGELYAFATNDGSCLVGKVVQSHKDSVDIYMYDRHFEPLSQKSDVLAALIEHKAPGGYTTNIERREFALMYPLWLAHQEVTESEAQSASQKSLTIYGKPIRFIRTRPYWDPIIIMVFSWLMVLVFALAICVPNNQSLPSALVMAIFLSGSIAIPLGGGIAFVFVIFRFLESLRTGFPMRSNPTLEFRLAMPLDEAFPICRDKLGAKTDRDFDFVDRRSGYIQARIQNHLLVRIMCYQLEANETGVIVSCFDLKGGTFGADMWLLKNLAAQLQAQEGETVIEQQPLVIGGFMRKFFWFAMTATFACVSAMFLKAAISGELTCLPLLLLTAILTGLAGFYLFRPTQETA